MGKRINKRLSPLIAVLYFVIRRLPAHSASSLMAYVLTKGGQTFVKLDNMRRNIRLVFPDLDEKAVDALASEMLANFGRHIAEIAHINDFKTGKNGACVDFSAPEGMTFDGKGPAIYVGGHVGSWELSPLIFHQKKEPVTVIYSPNTNPIIDNLLRTQRKDTGANYVEKAKSLRACHQALSRGESIALLADQRVDPGIEIDFFGRPAAITRLPAKLSTVFDCPIIPFEVVRIKPGHLRVMFQEPILPRGQKGKAVELDLTQKMASAVESSIRRNASAWFCSKLRWKRKDRDKIRMQSIGNPNFKPMAQEEKLMR